MPRPHKPGEPDSRILGKIFDLLCKILEAVQAPKRKKRVLFGWQVGQPLSKPSKRMPLDLTITNEQKVQVTLNPTTDTGKPAKLDGIPEWSVISGGSTLDVAADGKSAFLVSADDPGDTEFLVAGDADLGEGKEEISDVIRLHVAGANAKNLGLAASAPVPK
jgi:hypothetical protein